MKKRKQHLKIIRRKTKENHRNAKDIKTPYQDFANTNTGCYCKIVEYIQQKTNYKAKIFLVMPPYNYYNYDKWNILQSALKVIPQIAKRYELPIIDAYNECGMNAWNGATYRPNDNIHFNALGYKRLASYIASRILSYFKY